MIADPERAAPIAEAQGPGMGEERQEAGGIDPKGDPMPPGGALGPLGWPRKRASLVVPPSAEIMRGPSGSCAQVSAPGTG
jgi:hypothetical protein